VLLLLDNTVYVLAVRFSDDLEYGARQVLQVARLPLLSSFVGALFFVILVNLVLLHILLLLQDLLGQLGDLLPLNFFAFLPARKTSPELIIQLLWDFLDYISQGITSLLKSNEWVAEDGVGAVLYALEELLLVVFEVDFIEGRRRIKLLESFIEFRFSSLLLI